MRAQADGKCVRRAARTRSPARPRQAGGSRLWRHQDRQAASAGCGAIGEEELLSAVVREAPPLVAALGQLELLLHLERLRVAHQPLAAVPQQLHAPAVVQRQPLAKLRLRQRLALQHATAAQLDAPHARAAVHPGALEQRARARVPAEALREGAAVMRIGGDHAGGARRRVELERNEASAELQRCRQGREERGAEVGEEAHREPPRAAPPPARAPF
eukprot:scaffold72366_cov63-Phaeocystis_antarctica.AAC.3